MGAIIRARVWIFVCGHRAWITPVGNPERRRLDFRTYMRGCIEYFKRARNGVLGLAVEKEIEGDKMIFGDKNSFATIVGAL